MLNIKVPKCMGCKHLDAYKIGKHTYYDCYNPTTVAVWGMGARRIYARYITTSPKWCPLRENH